MTSGPEGTGAAVPDQSDVGAGAGVSESPKGGGVKGSGRSCR